MEKLDIKVSIITVCYNSERFIQNSIDSLHNQTYKNIEHIIVDGDSNDNTINIIKKTIRENDVLLSEPDKGLYDAMNKGIRLASGDIVGFLNSDDFYCDIRAVERIIEKFVEKETECVFANINYVEEKDSDKIVRKWKSGPFEEGAFKYGWHPAHPTFFLKNEIYKKYGSFNLKFKLASDFEIMLRMLEKHKVSNYYLDEAMIHMRLGGKTNVSLKNIIEQNRECVMAFRENNLKVGMLYPIYRLLPKIKEFFR